MTPWKYLGINNQPCTCEYILGNVNGKEVLVIKELPGATTSITNLLEHIVSSLLTGPLLGTDASKLRFFEFHSPTTAPLNVWLEVVFTVAKREPRLNFREKLKEYFHPTVKPYVVWNPVWQTVPIPLQAQLVAIDPVGLV